MPSIRRQSVQGKSDKHMESVLPHGNHRDACVAAAELIPTVFLHCASARGARPSARQRMKRALTVRRTAWRPPAREGHESESHRVAGRSGGEGAQTQAENEINFWNWECSISSEGHHM